jgi:hypothetical protein
LAFQIAEVFSDPIETLSFQSEAFASQAKSRSDTTAQPEGNHHVRVQGAE